jgi:putative transcriptional regulator
MGQRVRAIREGKGWSQKELADRIGMTRTAITNLECGRQKLPLDRLYKIADVFDVSIFKLIPERSTETLVPIKDLFDKFLDEYFRGEKEATK